MAIRKVIASFKAWRRPRNRRRDRAGATAVEMALIAPAFFLLLMGITEVTMMLTAQQIMESAAYSTSRLAKTGFTNSGQNQSQTVSQKMTTELQSFGSLIDTTQVTLTTTAYSSFAAAATGSGGTAGMGAAQQIVVYTISYPWKLFTPMLSALIGTNGTVTLTSHIVVRNEPYS